MKPKLSAYLCVVSLCALCATNVFAQTARGLSVIEEKKTVVEGKTYALIVGISKYQNAAIPSLQFADKDALAFYNYLRATGVDTNNIMLLLNEKAKNGDFWSSVNYISELAKQGDKVFIYFSGHGDVENKTIVKDAYLLPYDAPKCVYAAGAIGVLYLKSYLATLSANGVQVVFISDACRSGNLAGGREGMEAAASVLKDKWQDEIKMLSCQPGELSLEGKQWGNGRGLFSYELINGMAGLADRDKDGQVSLRELNLYLMEKVPDGANPMPQNPMLFGNMTTVISKVNPQWLKSISTEQNNTLAAIDVRGFDDALVTKLADTIQENYRLFKVYMDSNIFYRLDNKSAYTYYERIPVNDNTKLLQALMKRNLGAGMMNDLQDKINRLLKNDVSGIAYAYQNQSEARELKKMLGEERLAQLGFKPKLLFFDGFAPDTKNEQIAKLDSAIQLEPFAAYLYFAKGMVYHDYFEQPDSALIYVNRSIAISPGFSVPHIIKASIYISREPDKTILESDTLISLDSTLTYFGYLLKGFAYLEKDSLDTLKQYTYHDSVIKYYTLVNHLTAERDLDVIIKMVRLQTTLHFNELMKDYDQAKKHIMEAIEGPVKRFRVWGYFQLAGLSSIQLKRDEAILYLQQYFEAGGKDYDGLKREKQLDNIRNEPVFKSLMRKYFPTQYKE